MRKVLLSALLIGSSIWGGQALGANAHDDHDHGPKPVTFISNKGQWDPAVRFRADVIGATVFLENNALTWTKLEDRASEVMHDAAMMSESDRRSIRFNGHAWRMEFVDPSPALKILTQAEVPYYHNYFIGNDPSQWASKVPLFQEVTYSQVWPGIDMVLRSHEGHLKYDLMLAPGADPDRIAFTYNGLDGVELGEEGTLILRTSVGEVHELRPVVFYGDGSNESIACKYRLEGTILRFELDGEADRDRPIVIDPILIAATYSGATGASNYGHCAAYDEAGNIYTGARNFGPNYPASLGAFQTSFGGGGTDISVSKYNPDGSQLIWAAYLGGNSGENPHSLIANTAGELIVLGSTDSQNFPITPNAYDNTLAGQDITVTRISDDGTTLLGSTFIGGSGSDGTNMIPANYGEAYRGEVYLDQSNNILVVSFTSSNDFPVTTGAFQSTLGGSQDGVVFEIDPNCSNLIASTYLGGSNDDAAMGIRIADSGDIIVTGHTQSSNFPITPGAYQGTLQGGQDAIVARFSNDLSTLIAGTYFGTPGDDRGYFMDLDSQGSVWIYGQTTGQIPLQPAGVFNEANGSIFVAKLDPDLTQAPVTTAFGSGGFSVATVPVAFLVDVCDQIYICGYNSSSTLPITPDALYTSGSFYLSVFATDMANQMFGTYYGGSHVDGGTSRFDKNGIVYQGVCSGGQSMQSAPWAFAPVNQISWDVGVFKIDMQQSGVQVYIQTESTQGCAPATFTFTGSGNAPEYVWDMGDGTTGLIGDTILYTYEEVGTYVITLVGVDPATCNFSDTTMITVFVGDGQAPQASFQAQPFSSCDGFSAQFENTSTPASDIIWNFGDGESSSVNDPLHPYDAPGTYNVWLMISDDICGGSDSVMVPVVIPPPVLVYELASPVYLCEGSTVMLNAGSGYDTYSWSDGSTAQMTSVTTTGVYSVQVTDGMCEGEDEIEVLPVPELPKMEDVVGCPGLETRLSAPFPVNSILWNTGSDSTSIVVDETGMYWFTAIDTYGCTRIDTVEVNVIPVAESSATIPNVFTPNGDGYNDRFQVSGIGVTDFHMEVYNRWGQLVFTSSDPNNGWNGGKDNTANDTPDGTYYYIVTYKDLCSDLPKGTHHGHVTLLR